MNKEILKDFVNQIKDLAQKSKEDDYVNDGVKTYPKRSYLEYVLSDAEESIYYGEYVIALEDMLDNLGEVYIVLDEKIINLARQAFGERITVNQEKRLDFLTKLTIDKKNNFEQL